MLARRVLTWLGGALLTLLIVLCAALPFILRKRPRRMLRFMRLLFGRIFNPVYLWFVDRFHVEESIVYHAGRRSGREYATPLCVSHTSDGFIAPAAFGPNADWFRNLRVSTEARLAFEGNVYRVKPEIIDADAAIRSAGGTAGCPCWESLRVEHFVLLRPMADEPADRAG